MLRARFSQPFRLGRYPTFPSPWRLRSHLLHYRGIKDSSESSASRDAQDKPGSETMVNVSHSKVPLSPYDLDIKARMWEWTKRATINLKNCADDFTAKSKSTFSQLGCWLNQLTGYEEIEALKRGVAKQEERINACRQAARKAKKAYSEALIQRADSQREVNDLLQRKMTWTVADVARFTELVPQDHHLQQEESRMKVAVDEAEDMVEREFSQLMRLILSRYHEEQVWSDKIRSASTYGSLVALGLNMLVFISAILVVEPWKRRRLLQTFEGKISELSAGNVTKLQESMNVLGAQIEQQEKLLREWKDENFRSEGDTVVSSPSMIAGDGRENAISQGHPSKRHLKLAAVTTGAFVAGILTSILMTK